ncbi:hypothetical protein BpHYR1_044794, partial [Brachionus plicatilis]
MRHQDWSLRQKNKKILDQSWSKSESLKVKVDFDFEIILESNLDLDFHFYNLDLNKAAKKTCWNGNLSFRITLQLFIRLLLCDYLEVFLFFSVSDVLHLNSVLVLSEVLRINRMYCYEKLKLNTNVSKLNSENEAIKKLIIGGETDSSFFTPGTKRKVERLKVETYSSSSDSEAIETI